jgi:hypothetical protein
MPNQIPNQFPTGWELIWELVWDLDVGSALGFGIWSLGFDTLQTADTVLHHPGLLHDRFAATALGRGGPVV